MTPVASTANPKTRRPRKRCCAAISTASDFNARSTHERGCEWNRYFIDVSSNNGILGIPKAAAARHPASQQAQLARLGHGGRAIAYVKLSKNPVQMSFRGPYGDRQLVRDLLIAEPAAHSPKNFGFSRAEQLVLHDARLTLLPVRVVCQYLSACNALPEGRTTRSGILH